MSHEEFNREKPLETGSDRGFGLTVGGILMAIGAVRIGLSQELGNLEMALLAVGSSLVVLALVAPGLLSSLNKAWMRLGLLLSKIVTPIVMGLIYYTTVTPIGLIFRALGKDLLNIRKDPRAKSYWVVRDPPGPEPETMKNQF